MNVPSQNKVGQAYLLSLWLAETQTYVLPLILSFLTFMSTTVTSTLVLAVLQRYLITACSLAVWGLFTGTPYFLNFITESKTIFHPTTAFALFYL